LNTSFLDRLLRVDLIKWVSNVRPYVCPQKVLGRSLNVHTTMDSMDACRTTILSEPHPPWTWWLGDIR